MFSFLLSILLIAPVASSSDSLDTCLAQAPVQSPPPIDWSNDIPEMWTATPPVSPDSLRASLSQVRQARACFLDLDPSTIERPYLGNIVRTYHAETALLAALRRFDEAHGVFEESYSYLASDPSLPSTEAARTGWPPVLHQDHGYLHSLLGNLSAALNHYLMALQKTPEEEISQRIKRLLDVGVLHQRTQDYSSAHHYFQRAEQLFREHNLKTEGHASQRARLLAYQADLLLEKTLNTEFDHAVLKRARKLARQGRAIAEAGSKRYAQVSMRLSESLGYLGAFEDAYRLNREIRQYARSHDNVDLETFALLKLGVLHIQTDRWMQADRTLNRALRQAEALGDLDYQRRILRALGRLHEQQKDWSQAESYYRQGGAVIEKYRESLTATQWSTTAFAQWRDVHRGLVRTLLAQDRPREALTALDRSRARHLQDLRTQARVANQMPASARARLDSVSRTLSDVRTRLGKGTLSNAEEAALRIREAALMTTRQQILQLDSAMPPRPSIDEISDALARQDRTLVSYFLDDPWPVYDRVPRSAAFVLTADTLRTVSLSGLTQDSVQAQVTSISPLFAQQDQPHHSNAMHFDLRPLFELHERLYAPIAEHLSPDQPLTVIPDGPLFYVPFSMLVTATPGGRYDPSQARFVLHQRPTTLELATSMVVDTSSTTYSPSTFAPDLAAFGVTKFDTLRTIPSALRATLPGGAEDSSFALPPLPGVRAEMDGLSRQVGDAEVFFDEAATESRLASACRRAGVVHLASHAFVHPASPLQNAFLLRPDSASDGTLFLHELQSQERTIPLAVLSGCSTARGTLRGGEGMAGLQYAFRAMGAESTVSNLWPTADRPSAAITENFYRNLRDGLPKDRALRQAKLTHLETHSNEASPFFWAPSVLYGSPKPVPLEPPDAEATSTWPWWLSLLAVSALLAGVVGWLLARNAELFGRAPS